jgi:hypothetical protein
MRTKILQVLRPSPLTWLFLILLLLAQFLFCTRTLLNEPRQSTPQYGIGHPIEISYSDGVRQDIRIHWIILIANLTLSYFFSALSVALVKRATGLQNALPLYGGAALAVISLAFFVSIAFSRIHWGYAFRRPPVLQELKEVTEVGSIIPVATEQTAMGKYRFVIDPRASIDETLAYARQHPTDNYLVRMLLHLDEKHLLPEEMATSLGPYVDLYDRLPETGLLARAQDGYTSAGLLRGFIVEARDRSSSQLVFLSATGGQVSNDHYPRYEMVFERDSRSGQLTFINGQRYFFDVAGIEGMTWAAVWLSVSFIGVVVVLTLITLTGWRYALLALLFVAAVGILVSLDLLAAVSLYLRFLAVYAAFWVLIGGLLLRDTPVRLRLMLLIVFVAQIAAIRFVNWNSRKPFVRDFDRITDGMTEGQVDGIMRRHIKETDLPPIPLGEASESVKAVVYRHTDAGPGTADRGIVAFEEGGVVQKELLGSVLSRRPAPPAAAAAAGTVGGAGCVLLRWEEGLAVMIWHDISASSRGSGTTVGPIYRYQGYTESPGGYRFDWEVQTADGRTALFDIDGTRYDLTRGRLFIVRSQDDKTQVRQLDRDVSSVQTNRESIVAFARSDPDLASFIGSAPESMKGYELYSWQVQGEWVFVLVVGTNRLKTYDEISAPEVGVKGLDAIKGELDLLPAGEYVFWTAGRVPNTVLPPSELVGEIVAYCTQRGIRLDVEQTGLSPQPAVTPHPTLTPTATMNSTGTPYCRPSEASVRLSASTMSLEVGQSVSVTVTLANGHASGVRLGQVQVSLGVQPSGILVSDNLGPVAHPQTLEPGESAETEFALRAVAPGRATLTGSTSFEMHALDYSSGSWSGCRSGPLKILVTPAADEVSSVIDDLYMRDGHSYPVATIAVVSENVWVEFVGSSYRAGGGV